ncbi:MAG: cytochrome c3 family protein [Chloroflexota bacterium]
MRPNKRPLIILLLVTLLLSVFLLVACSEGGQTVEVTRVVTQEVEVPGAQVEVTRIVEVPADSAAATNIVIPFYDEWVASPHNDVEGEPFNHWNEEDPAEVPTDCAKCHSTPGYIDHLGADGSTAGVVDAPAPLGTTVECQACHNQVTLTKTSVVFPSGIEITNLGDEARCMECHQGRASTVSVNQRITDAGLDNNLDAVSEDMGFTNIHYYAAAATQYGTLVKGGYEYDGLAYDARFDHVPSHNTCIECHDMHTLEVKLDQCQACHTDVESVEDIADIRMNGSLVDYDGDGDMEEGIYYEIEGVRDLLWQAMTAYTTEMTGTPIGYSETTYPYFFNDTDADGTLSEEEAAFNNAFSNWTARLSKAAYNFQVSKKDPGVHAHGGKYIIQLLYDSTQDLNTAIDTPVDMTAAHRIDHGHFAGSEEAFRHWDAEGGVVPGTCAKCHSATGQPEFITEGVVTSQPASNGLNCGTCHNDVQEFTLYEVPSVRFPSGATVTFGERDSAANMCLNCHQGRESTVSVNQRIGDKAPDEVSEDLRFINIHYFAAGATLFGTEVKGAYEFEGREYTGFNEHVGVFNSCTECHDTHALEIVIEDCGECHEGADSLEGLRTIRMTDVDYDGDGDATEGVFFEIDTMREALYAAIQTYATDVTGTAIIYDAHAYPYWFADTDGNGRINDEEGGFASWTPNLLRAAYNYQDSQKDPGGFAHNSSYVLQILYDSIQAVGGDVTGMTRAEVRTFDN